MMNRSFHLLTYLDNPVVWAILGLALFCYILQFNLLLARPGEKENRAAATWLKVMPVLLSTLPL